LNPNVFEKPKNYVLVGDERMQVLVIDPQTVQFTLPAPKPGLLAHFANSYAQGFQPKHFLGKWDPELNPDADKNAQALGFRMVLKSCRITTVTRTGPIHRRRCSEARTRWPSCLPIPCRPWNRTS
jgi:hypothetical protein